MIHDPAEYPDIDTLPCQQARIEDRDWDVLAVFDACRWDVMAEEYDGPASVEQVRTPARRSTPDWVTRVWDQPGWEDVTYVSANPFTEQIAYMPRYETDLDSRLEHVKAWEDHWNRHCQTVLPNELTNVAQDYDPPIVIHYIQPHTPFVGKTSYRTHPNADVLPEFDGEEITASGKEYQLVQAGHISPEYAREAYRDNARLVINEIKRLATTFTDVVVTADHGEALGPEEWSHGGMDDPRARIVPWVEVEI